MWEGHITTIEVQPLHLVTRGVDAVAVDLPDRQGLSQSAGELLPSRTGVHWLQQHSSAPLGRQHMVQHAVAPETVNDTFLLVVADS